MTFVSEFNHFLIITSPATFHAVILAGEACKFSCETEFELWIQSHFCVLIRGTTHYCWDTSEDVLSHLIVIHDSLKIYLLPGPLEVQTNNWPSKAPWMCLWSLFIYDPLTG